MAMSTATLDPRTTSPVVSMADVYASQFMDVLPHLDGDDAEHVLSGMLLMFLGDVVEVA